MPMTVREVLHVKVVANEPVFTVRDDQGTTQTLTLANGSAFELMVGLDRCAHVIHRNDPESAISRGPQYRVTDCHILTTESGEHGIAVRTTEGFDLPLVLDRERRQL